MAGAMKCINRKCDASQNIVIDSRSAADDLVVRRRRRCVKCGFTYTTYEIQMTPEAFGNFLNMVKHGDLRDVVIARETREFIEKVKHIDENADRDSDLYKRLFEIANKR